ncbi:MAG: DUF1844 domain-containing protein [Pyrinomonadaceae bacterium]|nr:DUF1844 domain-containing protein [Pyrinomonadaceae bacterium]
MSEEQTNFKVTDRRLFNPDGSARDVPPEEKPEAPREVKPAEIPAAPQTPEPSITSSPAEPEGGNEAEVPLHSPYPAQPQVTAEEPEESELIGADDPASFANFMMSIASNAASSLGMMEHPVTGKREVDLELGKHWIDILGMLQQKTRGNLLAQEQQVLEGLLADLRMQFVSLTNATPPKARKFTGSDITGAR